MKPLLLLPLLLLAACGASEDALDTGTTPASSELSVAYDVADGSAPVTWTLVCGDPVSGSHPDAAAACAHLQELDEPFAPLPTDQMCTEQYGGPQTARVTGQWDGEPVDLELSRSNGCFISQWEGLVPLVPGTEGAVDS